MSENTAEKFAELQDQLQKGRDKKIRLEERLTQEKKNLVGILTTIKNKGIDPTKIDEVVKEKREEYNTRVSAFEEKILEMNKKLDAIEAAQ